AMVVRHAFTVDEWHRMGDAGLFVGETRRTELLDGEIVEMAPVGSRHAVCVDRLNALMARSVAGRAVVRVQNPVGLDDRSEPQPDLVLMRPPVDRYLGGHPSPDDTFLLVEVADSSLAFDRDVKAPLYGRAGVAETWVVDLDREVVLVFRQPGPDGYGERLAVGRGGRLEVAAVPGITVAVDDVLGPPA
ncbi:MAG TPA: Uma2 family endonuclease, partial [Acidimicrobiales bacterium]|nr:Uma2 family endonuclease [Acidimicrobiales bacterium]